MVQLCKLMTDVRFDLDDYARDDFFGAYTTDLSLLMAMKDFSLKQHIVENTLTGNSKGGIYECAIARDIQSISIKTRQRKEKLMLSSRKTGAWFPSKSRVEITGRIP